MSKRVFTSAYLVFDAKVSSSLHSQREFPCLDLCLLANKAKTGSSSIFIKHILAFAFDDSSSFTYFPFHSEKVASMLKIRKGLQKIK